MKHLFDAALVAVWLGLFAVLGLQATRADSAPDLFTRMRDAGVRLSTNIEDDRAYSVQRSKEWSDYALTGKWHACGMHAGHYFCTEFDGIPPQ